MDVLPPPSQRSRWGGGGALAAWVRSELLNTLYNGRPIDRRSGLRRPLALGNQSRVHLNTFGVWVRTAVGAGAPRYPFMATTHPCPGPPSHAGRRYSDLDMGLGLH